MPGEKIAASADHPKDGWKIKDLAAEASLADEDQIQRQILRGNESKGDPDERDIAGAVDADETPHGGEEAKTVQKREANDNG